jgi:energy-coupling factor transport system ATP-binding protein
MPGERNGEEALLSVCDLGFTYRDAGGPALSNVSFQLDRGDLLVVMGASGAGKSTLCRCLNGIIPHFLTGDMAGRVMLRGRDTKQLKVAECARHVGLVFQDFEAQLFATSAELEVAFGAESLGLPRPEIARRVRELLKLVGLSHLSARRPASLSGGEKQRLAIAAALAASPAVLVLDEATSDLDPVGKSAVCDLAGRITSDAGARAVVFAHHDAEEAVRASRLLVLSQGRVAALGTPEEVLPNVELLSANGVAPLATTSLFAALDLPMRPLAEAEAAEQLLRRKLGVREEIAQAWERVDVARRKAYGRPLVEVRCLSHAYDGGEPVLRSVSLTIQRGEYVAIIGQNGSGKTTLVKHLNGLLRPTDGDVLIDGKSARDRPLRSLAQQVGYGFQNPDSQIFASTVSEEVSFGPRNFGLDEQAVRSRVTESLQAVQLAGREDEDPFSLTKGERQRVAVASILAVRPNVLIFDEPTTGLDERESRSMMALIDDLNARGHTIIVVTHAMWLTAEFAHRVIVMQEGRVLLDAPTRSVFSQEDALREAAIVPPQVVRLSRRLGATALSVRELVEALREG